MKSVSVTIAAVLLIMIGISLAVLMYTFSSEVLEDVLKGTEESLETQSTNRLAKITISEINTVSNEVIIRNIGRFNVSGFNVYVNDVQSSIEPTTTVIPGSSFNINVTNPLFLPGDVVKVTTSQGAFAIDSIPQIGSTCWDSTPYNQCSAVNTGYYCYSGGILNESCTQCPGKCIPSECNPITDECQAIFSPGLVGFWAFDGDTTDGSGNGNDGTNFGATWTSNAVSGQALTFDGASDYVEIPFHESLQVEDGNFTIAAWVNGIDNQKAQNIYIVGLNDDLGFRVAVGGNDNLGMWFRRADSSTGAYDTGNQVLDGTWHYIAVTKNGNTYTFYDNGQYVDDTTLSQALIVQSNVRRIGAWSSTYGNFNGIIDEVKIWNRGLSGTEINNEFNQYTPPSPPTSPLVGFWTFDENSGTSAGDSSDYNNDGNLYSGTTECSNPPTAGCPEWISGVNNTALQFDGSNDYVSVSSDTTLDITDNITVAAWVSPNTDTGYRRIVSKQYQTDQTTGNSCYQLGINTDNRWRWSIVTNVAYYNRLADAAYNPEIGKWYHFVGTYNGTHMVMYVNGQPIYTGTASGSIRVNSSEPVTIANSVFDGGRSFHFNGKTDEVKIWNRSLSASEILNEYNLYTPPAPSDLVGFWFFDDSGDNIADDSSGNGNDGTLINGTQWVPGLNGTALQFDGINDFVNFGDKFDDLSTSSGSLLWWVKFNNIATPVTQRFWGKHTNYEARWSGGTINFDIGMTNALTAPISFEVGKWYHLAFIWNSSNSSFYVNGARIRDGSPITLPQTADEFHLGHGGINWYTNAFNGVVEEFQIWNKTLSASEIDAEYQKYASGQWGRNSSSFTSVSLTNNMRCMGGQAPSLPNMKISLLHMRFNGSTTGAMAVYYGGSEGDPTTPTQATKQAEVINQAVGAGWNTFILPSDIDWPAGQVTWICWKKTGSSVGVYYSSSSANSGNFFNSHGRFDQGPGDPTVPFPNTIAGTNASYWYETFVTYYQSG